MFLKPRMNAVTAMATFVATSVYNEPVISSNEPDLADRHANKATSFRRSA